MARQHIPLKNRVVYEGKAQEIDRRDARDAALDKAPTPIYHIVSSTLRSKFGKRAAKNGTAKRNGTTRAATKRKVTV